MQYIVYIILALILLFLAIYMIVALFISLPAWGLGVFSVFIVQWLFKRRVMAQLERPSRLGRLATMSINEDEVIWTQDKVQLEEFLSTHSIIAFVTSVLIGACITITLMSVAYFFLDSLMDFVVSCIVAAIAFIYISMTISERFKKGFDNQINIELQGRSSELNVSLKDLSRLNTEVHRIAINELDIYPPWDYLKSVETFCESKKIKILNNMSVLSSFINKETKRATEDKFELEKAANKFNSTLQLYKSVVVEVNKSGSVAFIVLLDDLYKGLYACRDYLLVRNWKGFHEGVDYAVDELRMLSRNAKDFQGYSTEEDYTVKEDPYDILGVSREMSDEEIKIVYKQLSNIYHPDKNKVKFDKRMKAINKAYDDIIRERKS